MELGQIILDQMDLPGIYRRCSQRGRRLTRKITASNTKTELSFKALALSHPRILSTSKFYCSAFRIYPESDHFLLFIQISALTMSCTYPCYPSIHPPSLSKCKSGCHASAPNYHGLVLQNVIQTTMAHRQR